MCSKKLKIIHLMFDNDTKKKIVCKSTIIMDNVSTNDVNIIRDAKSQIHNLYNKWLSGYQFLMENYTKKGKKINVDNKIKEVYYKMEIVCEFMKGNSPNPFVLMYEYELDAIYCKKFNYDSNTKQLVEINDEQKKNSVNKNSVQSHYVPQFNQRIQQNSSPSADQSDQYTQQSDKCEQYFGERSQEHLQEYNKIIQSAENNKFRMYNNYYNYQ